MPHQRDLAASFGVSIAVAREALALLTAGGLVRARSGQGTFVTDQPEAALRFPAWVAAPMGAEELTEAIEARDVIEHATAIRAAHRRSKADVVRLRELVGQMADAGDDAAAFIEADLALHLAIAAAARNRPLAGALAALHRALRDTVAIGVQHGDRGGLAAGARRGAPGPRRGGRHAGPARRRRGDGPHARPAARDRHGPRAAWSRSA